MTAEAVLVGSLLFGALSLLVAGRRTIPAVWVLVFVAIGWVIGAFVALLTSARDGVLYGYELGRQDTDGRQR